MSISRIFSQVCGLYFLNKGSRKNKIYNNHTKNQCPKYYLNILLEIFPTHLLSIQKLSSSNT
jgi:hypothetical protein